MFLLLGFLLILGLVLGFHLLFVVAAVLFVVFFGLPFLPWVVLVVGLYLVIHFARKKDSPK